MSQREGFQTRSSLIIQQATKNHYPYFDKDMVRQKIAQKLSENHLKRTIIFP